MSSIHLTQKGWIDGLASRARSDTRRGSRGTDERQDDAGEAFVDPARQLV